MNTRARPRSDEMAQDADRLWTPTDAQRQFLRRREYEALFGGAKGPGKTDALIFGGLRQIHHPRYHAAIFRRTYKEAQEIIDRMQEVFPKLGASWNGTDKRWTFPSGARYSVFYLDQESDKHNHDGKEYQYLAFDQLEQFSETQYLHLMGCSRSSVPGLTPLIRSSANPGGPGHLFVKRRFIDLGPMQPYVDPETGLSRVFVPGKVWDNPYIVENDPQYIQRLMAQPEDVKRAYLEGDWDVFAGQFFSEFRRQLHVTEPFEVPEWWEREGGMDWGYRAPTVVVAGAVDPYGRVVGYKELVVREASPTEVADRIHETFSAPEERDLLIRCDPSMAKRMPESGVTILDRINERLDQLGSSITLVKADNERTSGWQRVRDYLYPDREHPEEKGETCPWLRFMRGRCEYTIETLPTLVHDEDKPEEMADGEDHAADAWRYLLMARPPLAELPRQMQEFPSHERRVHERTRKVLEKIEERRRQQLTAGHMTEDEAHDYLERRAGHTPEEGLGDIFSH